VQHSKRVPIFSVDLAGYTKGRFNVAPGIFHQAAKLGCQYYRLCLSMQSQIAGDLKITFIQFFK
jgi:hypothetical protein